MYEELIKRLRRCEQFRCRECEYEQVIGCRTKLNEEAADAIEELSKPQNTVHLCTSCKYQYPECPSDTGVVFGRGKGNDNICQCADYVARIPRWIPVTERLPEDLTRVIVFCEDGVSFGLCEHLIADDEEVVEWHDFLHYPITPTHWMPLPEPPKEES